MIARRPLLAGSIGRRPLLAGLAGAALAAPRVWAQAKKPVIVAEPLHSVGYLPLYIAVAKGYFDADGLDVHILTVESGSGHTNAVLSGQAFAFIGGPEHDAFAKLRGAELRSVVNIVDRGNVYVVAAKGVSADPANMGATLKGHTIATGPYGGTPNSITRYIVAKAGLALSDVRLAETTSAGTLAAVSAGQAQFAVVTEPQVTQGIRAGLWGEPFYNVPKQLGPYAYSTINCRQDSIEKDPAMVEIFVRNLIRGLQFTYNTPDEAAVIARKEFPTMPLDDMRATLDRSFADALWSHDGLVTQQGWTTAKDVVMTAGLLKQDVPYDAIIDMSFVKKVTG